MFLLGLFFLVLVESLNSFKFFLGYMGLDVVFEHGHYGLGDSAFAVVSGVLPEEYDIFKRLNASGVFKFLSGFLF
jgi:hypothetical protein